MKNERGVQCKLDIKKAYDFLNGDFLLLVLQSMGFWEKWIDWIKWYVSTSTFLFLINGSHSSRGLGRGDPLYPYLFVIGIEAFSTLIDKAAS